MVHSVELLFDPDTGSAIRSVWDALSDAGLRSPAPTSRPHLTLLVAEEISSGIDEPLSPVLTRLPLGCVIGAPMVFGRSPFILVRQVVPSTELLDLHAEVARIGSAFLKPAAAPNTSVGQWTPHTTLARRVEASQLARAIELRRTTRDIHGHIVGLRRWDGDKRVEHLIT